ncbi:ATP-binding cassette domain-containing protein [Aeoliella sp. ICT_H6.2]|uniref:ATP-binding cassette domain-containing protein n=1 Tax=Aeoliella straminimaris TaxID=2954799 RepID=A0A9X2FDX4_9BACT|nr:ATP-binding cassette domain-containing protein [Aeoliella straminimaris]MCO6047312.1 ATP-binding cassette domain-containing protein [Aeoliella straminimaris]
MIEANGLAKVYDDLKLGPRVAVADLTFRAEEGEVFGLLGPNGAGKTTALRILATLLKPTSGYARINGFDCETQPELVRHQIGYISASAAMYDRMTAWEMVEYFGQLHHIEPQLLRERMERLFDRLAMNEIRDVLGGKMSTGMKQKVAIARAMVHDPPVLIFDEATNGLDVLVARSLLDTVRELRDQGKCIIFSSHIMREVERLCTRIAIMHRGRILAEGSLEQLRAEYQSEDFEDVFLDLIGREEKRLAEAAQAAEVEVAS